MPTNQLKKKKNLVVKQARNSDTQHKENIQIVDRYLKRY